jgi:hypothetical protein
MNMISLLIYTSFLGTVQFLCEIISSITSLLFELPVKSLRIGYNFDILLTELSPS